MNALNLAPGDRGSVPPFATPDQVLTQNTPSDFSNPFSRRKKQGDWFGPLDQQRNNSEVRRHNSVSQLAVRSGACHMLFRIHPWNCFWAEAGTHSFIGGKLSGHS